MLADSTLKPELFVRSARSPETDSLLPGFNDAYKAAGTPDNHEVSCLVLVMGKDGARPGVTAYYLVQYVHLGMAEFGFAASGEQEFRFLVSDLKPRQVTVRGRNLLRTAHYIGLRRMPWIRVCDRDFGAEASEPVITGITVEDWEPEEQ